MLLCGINACSPQWCGFIFILWYAHLNLKLLLHKTVLITFLLASTVPNVQAGVYKGAWLCTQYLSLNLGKGKFCAPKFLPLLRNCAPNFEFHRPCSVFCMQSILNSKQQKILEMEHFSNKQTERQTAGQTELRNYYIDYRQRVVSVLT